MTPATKGDILAIERRQTTTFVNGGRTLHTWWELGVVESATRDGVVKTARGGPYRSLSTVHTKRSERWIPDHGIGNVMVAPRSSVDVDAIPDDVMTDTYVGLAEIRSALDPYRRA